MISPPKVPGSLAIAIALWGAVVVAGFLGLGAHAARPGDGGTPAASWPSGGRMPFHAGRHNLAIFLHPRCPCSRASLAEFARIMARGGDRLSARVVLVIPPGAPAGWAGEALGRDAAAIPGVAVVVDAGGTESRRFGARTSGHAMLYDPAGRLRYSGGITPSRGHEGDSAGRDAILAEVGAVEEAGTGCGPVYGCPLSGNRPKPGMEEDR